MRTIGIKKCKCGHESCDSYFINWTGSDGRLSKEDAEIIMKAVNMHDKLVSALKKAHEHLEWTGYGDRYERECARAEGLPEMLESLVGSVGD
jgi:hypothetical protein